MRKPLLADVMARMVDESRVRSQMNQSRRHELLEQLRGEIERASGLKVARLWLDERGAVRVEYAEENPNA